MFTSADHAAASPAPVASDLTVSSAPSPIIVIEPPPLLLAPEPEPLTRERIILMVEETWPEDPRTAVRILECESKSGDHADTFSLEAANAGPMQLNQATWRPFFEIGYGWSWEQVVTDIATHLRAARIIYDRASGWGPWRCY